MTITEAKPRLDNTEDLPDTDAHAPSRWGPKLWAVLFVAGLAMFLDALDVSMVGVALPSIGAELGLETSSLQWIVNGYILGYGGLLLLGGRMADLLGRRKVFLTALVVFGVASLVGGLVDNEALLIASRIVKGVAAAFTAPAALSIITTTFKEGHDRNKALSIFTVFGATGYASGLIASGLLTSIDWRLTFFAPVAVVAAVIIAAFVVVPRDKEREAGGIDFAGSVTLTGGMLAAVYTIVTVPETGFTPLVITTTVAAVVLLGAFFVIENKVAHPLVRLSIFKVKSIVRANLAALAIFGSYISFQTIVSLYLQNTLQLGADPDGARAGPGRDHRRDPLADRRQVHRPLRHQVDDHRLAGLVRPRLPVVHRLRRRHRRTELLRRLPALVPAAGPRLRDRLLGRDGPGHRRHRRTTSRAWPPAWSRPPARSAARSSWRSSPA